MLHPHQVQNISGNILLDRNERDWTINQLRDYIIDLSESMFNSNAEDIQGEYFIDKIVNTNSLIEISLDHKVLELFKLF